MPLWRAHRCQLGIELGPITLKTFPNDEVYCRFDESIRGADVFLIQPMCGNAGTGITQMMACSSCWS
ncbi:ribose-phosphate pyrophosphokinase-like domain-containing protein [Pseudonocardia oceani]|uniref:ribose-phosphate pyrophosphokinase-like domain-containing protein n=1 Tax=Pseudonocardia oceani TaxID=2792013 RepID=UPI0027DFCEDC|nr:ribose-phosphate pyrophosphokinase-like domain-containing protein [Pseudonocardia oceani]